MLLSFSDEGMIACLKFVQIDRGLKQNMRHVLEQKNL